MKGTTAFVLIVIAILTFVGLLCVIDHSITPAVSFAHGLLGIAGVIVFLILMAAFL